MSGAEENNFKWTYGVRVIANQIDRANVAKYSYL